MNEPQHIRVVAPGMVWAEGGARTGGNSWARGEMPGAPMRAIAMASPAEQSCGPTEGSVYGLCHKPWACPTSELLDQGLFSPGLEPCTQEGYLRTLQRWFVELALDYMWGSKLPPP